MGMGDGGLVFPPRRVFHPWGGGIFLINIKEMQKYTRNPEQTSLSRKVCQLDAVILLVVV